MAWILSAFADEAATGMDDQIRACTEAGIDHIDLRNVDEVNIVDLPLDHARAVQEKLDAAGVHVCMYGSPIGKIDLADDPEIDRQRLRHLGELKKIFGARAVRIFSYFNDKTQADEAAWRREALDRLRQLAELAADLDLVLYHENELKIFGDTCRRICVLRDEVHRLHPESFKLIFDFDNFNQLDEDVWENWLQLRDDVEAIHLKESKKQPDGSFQHVPAGQGDGHIVRILQDLADRGWEGPLTLEPHLARSPAVLATGPHGQANQSLADLDDFGCFQLAASEAVRLLEQVGRRG